MVILFNVLSETEAKRISITKLMIGKAKKKN